MVKSCARLLFLPVLTIPGAERSGTRPCEAFDRPGANRQDGWTRGPSLPRNFSLFWRPPRNQSDVGAKHFVQIACAIGLYLF